VSIGTFELAVILIVVGMLLESISLQVAMFELTSIHSSKIEFLNSVAVVSIVLDLVVLDCSPWIIDCYETIHQSIFLRSPVASARNETLAKAMQSILLPFSNFLQIHFIKHPYSNSLQLTLGIDIPFVDKR
jgi:hypothetical protein